MVEYNATPNKIKQVGQREIACFDTSSDTNIDKEVIDTFGQEWQRFHNFKEDEIIKIGEEYFDILDESKINDQVYAIDIGCGSGRWTKYLSSKVKFVEAVDPSNAIFIANNLLSDVKNVRLTQASVSNLPFPNEIFDFGMSVGVLHHIPDTQRALIDCVAKIKPGGHFYVYLYYDLSEKTFISQFLFSGVDVARKIINRMHPNLRNFICDLIAGLIYYPLSRIAALFYFLNLKKISNVFPLHYYRNKSFFVMRNDALDRFGTTLEQRFSKQQVITMMENAGLCNIIVSDRAPFWHAVGNK